MQFTLISNIPSRPGPNYNMIKALSYLTSQPSRSFLGSSCLNQNLPLYAVGTDLNGFRGAKGLKLERLQEGRDSVSVTAECSQICKLHTIWMGNDGSFVNKLLGGLKFGVVSWLFLHAPSLPPQTQIERADRLEDRLSMLFPS